MLIVRYLKNSEIIDEEINQDEAYEILRKYQKKYSYAELILVENGVEYNLL